MSGYVCEYCGGELVSYETTADGGIGLQYICVRCYLKYRLVLRLVTCNSSEVKP